MSARSVRRRGGRHAGRAAVGGGPCARRRGHPRPSHESDDYRPAAGMSREAIASIGTTIAAAGGLLGALLMLLQPIRTDVGEVRRDLHALSDRVARIEGALTGPWRSTNRPPAPAAVPPPEPEATP